MDVERLGAPTQPFRFDRGGEVRHPDFAATWAIGDADAVILTASDGQAAVLALDLQLAGWQGTDFDGKRLVWGRALRPAKAVAPGASNEDSAAAPARARER